MKPGYQKITLIAREKDTKKRRAIKLVQRTHDSTIFNLNNDESDKEEDDSEILEPSISQNNILV
jgi:hypothetical protein